MLETNGAEQNDGWSDVDLSYYCCAFSIYISGKENKIMESRLIYGYKNDA